MLNFTSEALEGATKNRLILELRAKLKFLREKSSSGNLKFDSLEFVIKEAIQCDSRLEDVTLRDIGTSKQELRELKKENYRNLAIKKLREVRKAYNNSGPTFKEVRRLAEMLLSFLDAGDLTPEEVCPDFTRNELNRYLSYEKD
ncbi:MAG: hypothetical protein ABEJ24_04920 [Candidatus Magasanikbacteria bacterium]